MNIYEIPVTLTVYVPVFAKLKTEKHTRKFTLLQAGKNAAEAKQKAINTCFIVGMKHLIRTGRPNCIINNK